MTRIRRDIIALGNALRPVMRIGGIVACRHCHTLIDVDDIYFVNTAVIDEVLQPWCRSCAIGILLALNLVDVETAFSIPLVGPVPTWMDSRPPRYWESIGYPYGGS